MPNSIYNGPCYSGIFSSFFAKNAVSLFLLMCSAIF